MKTRTLIFGLLLLSGCAAGDFSGYGNLPTEKRKHFIPFSLDSLDRKTSYEPGNFTVQELHPGDVQKLATASKYTWVVIWAPWCAGTKEIAQDYIAYEQQLAEKDIRLVFVAIAYGPEGIRKTLHEMKYQKPTYVIPYVPNQNGGKIFRKALNPKYKYRNANHYILERDKGVIYTGKAGIMTFQELQKALSAN